MEPRGQDTRTSPPPAAAALRRPQPDNLHNATLLVVTQCRRRDRASPRSLYRAYAIEPALGIDQFWSYQPPSSAVSSQLVRRNILNVQPFVPPSSRPMESTNTRHPRRPRRRYLRGLKQQDPSQIPHSPSFVLPRIPCDSNLPTQYHIYVPM